MISEPHTCLKPHPREPYVCLHVRIVRPDEHGPWVLTCQEPGCSHTATGPIAADLADLGRIHTASHGGRS